jgi:hypothetical protein
MGHGRRQLALLLVVGCGRVGFDAIGASGDAIGNGDAPPISRVA